MGETWNDPAPSAPDNWEPSWEDLQSLEDAHNESVYNDWLAYGSPFDLTGESYLEEGDKPRPLASEGEHFERVVENARAIMAKKGQWPMFNRADSAWMAEIDECIFNDGDYLLREDGEFLRDARNVERLAIGRELHARDPDFFRKLRELGPTPGMVREANNILNTHEFALAEDRLAPCDVRHRAAAPRRESTRDARPAPSSCHGSRRVTSSTGPPDDSDLESPDDGANHPDVEGLRRIPAVAS